MAEQNSEPLNGIFGGKLSGGRQALDLVAQLFRVAEPGAVYGAPVTQGERTVILARFGLDGAESRTLEEIGQEMGLTRERVRQIETAALARLRGIIERKTMKRADLL